ncbi:MAG: hypothetical protein M1812_002171 [Candelaria pacifica]|nr:MAG: hypothetical protein M1812_002171 [Candelaria pacifica]
MFISKEELRRLSKWISDDLDPQISQDDQDVLDHDTLRRLRTFFTALGSTTIDIEDIGYSKVDRALLDICKAQTKWPADLVKRAEISLQTLEQRLGSLRKETLEELRALEPYENEEVMQGGWMERVDQQLRKDSWLVTGGDPERAYAAGHNGFEVGDWWIKAAYAYLDGIIDDSRDGITADEEGAYAILLGKDQEIDSGRPDMIVYKATSIDRGKFMLMRNLKSRLCVRILRSWKQDSVWAPRAGVRYDGLYAVTGYGIKLNTIQKDEWVYTFKLTREDGQPSLESALRHPTAEEYSEWKDYEKGRDGYEDDKRPLTTVMTEMTLPIKEEIERPAEDNEGYFAGLRQQ